MCTEIIDLGRYKSVGCCRAAFVIFTASFTLLKWVRLLHRLKSSCSWHTVLFVNWEKWELQECFTSRQWPGLPGECHSALEWHSDQQTTSGDLVTLLKPEELLTASSAAQGTLAWLCCPVPATRWGWQPHQPWLSKRWLPLLVIVGVFVKVEGVFLHFRENSNIVEKLSVCPSI